MMPMGAVGFSSSRPRRRALSMMFVVGVATPWCMAHVENATPSGGACADQLWTLESAAVTRHLNRCGRHENPLPAGDHRWGHHLLCPTVLFSRTPGPEGGDRWVGHTGFGSHRRVGHLRRSPGIGWPDHRRWVVVTPRRGGPGRGAGISANRSASSRSHRPWSCCGRIHSASTIAAASSSRLVAHAVLVATSLTPFPECCAPGPAMRRVRR